MDALHQALKRPWTSNYLRLLTVILGVGAAVHVANILGASGTPWAETPLSWRVMDVVLLIFNVVVGIGLWFRRLWAVAVFVVGILGLQILPYTAFRSEFATTPEQAAQLDQLVLAELLLLALLFVLVYFRK